MLCGSEVQTTWFRRFHHHLEAMVNSYVLAKISDELKHNCQKQNIYYYHNNNNTVTLSMTDSFGASTACRLLRRMSVNLKPFTARVFDGVFWGDSTVWVCGQNPMIWPHSNEISLTVLTLGAIWFSKFEKMKLEHLVEICFWLNWQWKGYIKVCFSRLAVLYWIVCLFVCFFLSYLVIKKRKEVNYVQFWLW